MVWPELPRRHWLGRRLDVGGAATDTPLRPDGCFLLARCTLPIRAGSDGGVPKVHGAPTVLPHGGDLSRHPGRASYPPESECELPPLPLPALSSGRVVVLRRRGQRRPGNGRLGYAEGEWTWTS